MSRPTASEQAAHEDYVRTQVGEGRMDTEIAAESGLTRSSVLRIRRRLGLEAVVPQGRRKPWKADAL